MNHEEMRMNAITSLHVRVPLDPVVFIPFFSLLLGFLEQRQPMPPHFFMLTETIVMDEEGTKNGFISQPISTN